MKLMGGKIKNLFFDLTATQKLLCNFKQLIFAVLEYVKHSRFLPLAGFLFFVMLGLTLPLMTSAQNPFDIVGIAIDAIVKLIGGIFALGIGLIAYIAAAIFGTINSIAIWVIKDVIMNVPLVKGPFIDIAWRFTRDLVNMIFILVLAFIGLATILRIREYEVGKILPKLILIALLINFSPVMVGVIVDGFNILTNFFLSKAELDLSGALSNVNDYMGNLWNIFISKSALDMIGEVVQGIIIIVFYLLASFIYLLVSLIFLFRIIAIWFLVILSPFAFAAFILPVTKRWWDTWWNQLIQWSFIGVTVSFFLYLGGHLLNISPVLLAETGYQKGIGGLPEVISSLFPYFVSLVFLGIGMVFGLQTGAMGGGAIINWGKRAGRAVGRFATAQTLGRYLAYEKTKGEESWMRRLEAAKFGLPETRGEWKKAGWGRRALGALTAPIAYPARWGLRAGLRTGLEYGAKQIVRVEDLAKGYEEVWKDRDRGYNQFHMQFPVLNYQQKIAHVLAAARTHGTKGLDKFRKDELRGVIKDMGTYYPEKLEDVVKFRKDLIEDEEVGKIIQEKMVSKAKGVKDDDLREILEKERGIKFEDLARERGITLDDFEKLPKAEIERILREKEVDVAELFIDTVYKKAAGALKRADVRNLTRKVIDDPTLPEEVNKKYRQTLVKYQSTGFIREVGEELGSDYVDKLHDEAEELGVEEIAKTNPTLLRSAVVNPGFHAIFPPIRGAETRDEIAGLRMLVREPLFLELRLLQRRIENLRRRPETPELREELEAAQEEFDRRQAQIETNPRLRERWHEIERLRRR